MKYSKDDIIEALRCCSLNGRNSCETCPLKEECEESPLESVLAKYTLEVVDKLIHENSVLTEQRNTYREYALQMHAMVEGIKVKVDEGYDYSYAKHAAEMDMWRVIAAEKQALQDEVKMRKADTEELYKEMSERMKEEIRIAKKYTAKRIREGIKETMFNPNNKFDFIYDETFSIIDKVLEECEDEKDS